MMHNSFDAHATTILAVRRNDMIALGGDGQVTLGNTVMKANARKVRRLAAGRVLAVLLVAPPMRSRCSSALRASWKNTATSRAPRSSSPRTGARIAICAGSRPCSWSVTRRISLLSPAMATLSSRSMPRSRSAQAVPLPRLLRAH